MALLHGFDAPKVTPINVPLSESSDLLSNGGFRTSGLASSQPWGHWSLLHRHCCAHFTGGEIGSEGESCLVESGLVSDKVTFTAETFPSHTLIS